MRSVKEQYWRYSLFVIILVLGVVIFAELTPYIGGLLGAMTIYVLLRRQMRYLTVRRRWRRSLAASVLLVEAIVCFLIPLSGIVWMFVDKVQDFTLDPQSLISSIRHVSEQIRLRIGYDLLQDSNISSMVAVITRFGQAFLQGIFSFGVNIVMLLFVLYFMLIGGTRMENYCRAMLPFNATVARNVTNEIYMIVRSNAIGIPLIAVVQGSIAYAGYLVCGVPSALFWGVVTCFATILPVVGTALVWVPLAAYLAVEGSWGAAVGLMALRRARRYAVGQCDPVHFTEENGRHASARDDSRRAHRPAAFRVHGRYLRPAAAGDVRLLRPYLQAQIPRRRGDRASVRSRQVARPGKRESEPTFGSRFRCKCIRKVYSRMQRTE